MPTSYRYPSQRRTRPAFRLRWRSRATGYERDITEWVTGLSYSSRLPGGFSDCGFTLTGPLRSNRIAYLDDLSIDYAGSLVWEGFVAEITTNVTDTASLKVAGLGYSALLKSATFRRCYVDSDPTSWQRASDLHTAYTNSTNVSVSNEQTAQGDSVQITVAPNGQAVTTTDDCEVIWQAPVGNPIRRVELSYQSLIGAAANGRFRIMAADTFPSAGPGDAAWAETVLAYTSMSTTGTTGTVAVNLSGTGRRYLMLQYDSQVGRTAAVDEYVRLYNLRIICADDPLTGSPLQASQMTFEKVMQSLISLYGGDRLSTSMVNVQAISQPLFTSLNFKDVTSVEDALQKMNDVMGWDWAIFDNGELWCAETELFPVTNRSKYEVAAAPGYVNRWLAVKIGDGAKVNIGATLDGAYNQVSLTYRDTTTPYTWTEITQSDYGSPANPLNSVTSPVVPTLQRTKFITYDQAPISTAQAQYLLGVAARDAFRPIIKGEVVVSVQSYLEQRHHNSVSPGQDIAAALVRPGQWIRVTDVPGLGDIPSLGGSANTGQAWPHVVPIREVTVDTDSGEITLGIDATRDRLSAVLARLQQGFYT